MGAILLHVALHMAIMLGRAHWHCWSPMHLKFMGTIGMGHVLPALDPVGCSWTDRDYEKLDVLDWLPELPNELWPQRNLRAVCVRSYAPIWPITDLEMLDPVGQLGDYTYSGINRRWPPRPKPNRGKAVVEILRFDDRSLVLLTDDVNLLDLRCAGSDMCDHRDYDHLDLDDEFMLAWVRAADLRGRQMLVLPPVEVQSQEPEMLCYADYLSIPSKELVGNCALISDGYNVRGGMQVVMPGGRTWAPPGTPLFDAKLRWLGIARHLFLLGEAVDEGPFMVCHRAVSHSRENNRIVCIPRILRAPECERGW
jgi:hypothetical protein